MKNVLLGFAAAIVIVCAAFLFLQHQAQEKLRAENESLAQQFAQLQTDNESLSNRLATVGDSKSLTDEQFNELLKLRGEVGKLRQQTNELGKLREENRQLNAAAVKNEKDNPQKTSEPLITRAFKIEPTIFFQNLKQSIPANDGETPSETFGRFLKQNGVDLNPPEVFL
jgi:predicted nuclease with TOPRIM domain